VPLGNCEPSALRGRAQSVRSRREFVVGRIGVTADRDMPAVLSEDKLDKRGKRKINLYQAFGAVCRDEEMFREELKRYADIEEPRVLPSQIPPLVPSHMLKPTAANKMYNAKITYRNFGERLSESTFAPTEPEVIKENRTAFEALLDGTSISIVEVAATLINKQNKSRLATITAKIAKLTPTKVVSFLAAYQFYNPGDPFAKLGGPMLEQLDFLKRTDKYDPGIDDWLLFAPQVSDPRGTDILAGTEFGVVFRSRPDEGNRLSTYNDPVHRKFAEYISMQGLLDKPNDRLKALRRPRRGVIIFYSITDIDKPAKAIPPFTPGFTLLFPPNDIDTTITFGVVSRNQPNALIVTTTQ
jgi:hypothetical protein